MFNRRTEVILLVYGKGGHAAQMQRFLTNQPNDEKKYRYITLSNAELCFPNIIDRFYCNDARDKYYWYKSLFVSIAYVFLSFIQMLRIFSKYKVVGMISTGPGLAVVPAMMCRALFKKVVFFEDWCRFSTPSIAGRMMYFLSNEFLIQQKSIQKFYPKSTYVGRL